MMRQAKMLSTRLSEETIADLDFLVNEEIKKENGSRFFGRISRATILTLLVFNAAAARREEVRKEEEKIKKSKERMKGKGKKLFEGGEK